MNSREAAELGRQIGQHHAAVIQRKQEARGLCAELADVLRRAATEADAADLAMAAWYLHRARDLHKAAFAKYLEAEDTEQGLALLCSRAKDAGFGDQLERWRGVKP